MHSDEKKNPMNRLLRLQSIIRTMWSALDKSLHEDLDPLEVQHLSHVAEIAFDESMEALEGFQALGLKAS